MAGRKELLDTLRDELSKIGRRLGKYSLARCSKGAQRDFLAKQFIKPFQRVSIDEFDEMLYEWMTGDRPDPCSVQTVIQVLIETGNETCVDTVLDCNDIRVGEGLPPLIGPVQKLKVLFETRGGEIQFLNRLRMPSLQPFDYAKK